MNNSKTSGFTSPILILLLVVASFLMGMIWTQSRQPESNQATPETVQVTPSPAVEQQVLGESAVSVGNFKVLTEAQICLENDLPIVYYFGSSTCPHCKWEHPVISSAAEQFDGYLSFHDNMDKPDADQAVWDQYASLNRGSIPFIVVGCKYWQLGSGESFGEEKETENLTALFCKLTDNQPEAVCAPLQEVIDSIE